MRERLISQGFIVIAVALAVFAWGTPSTHADSGNYSWTQSSAGNQTWLDVTSSYDGTVLSSAAFQNYIYVSTSSGATWTAETSAGSRQWYAITASSNGSTIAAVVNPGDVFLSTTTGATWTDESSIGSRDWTDISASASGSIITAVASPSDIFISTTTGATWTDESSSGNRDWQTVTTSGNGSVIAAAVWGGGIYVSTTTGATWTQATSAPNENWISITSSADGSHLAAAAYSDPSFTTSDGTIWLSSDYGKTWTQDTNIGLNGWYWIAYSPDGTHLAAVAGNAYGNIGTLPGYIYTSLDGGATWAQETQPGQANWEGAAFTLDNSRLVTSGAQIWLGGPAGGSVNVASTPPMAPMLEVNVTGVSVPNIAISSLQTDGVSSVGYSYMAVGSATTTVSFPTNGPIAVNAPLTDLSCGTTYTIWSFATNNLGTTNSSAIPFTTKACAPGSAVASSGGGGTMSVLPVTPTPTVPAQIARIPTRSAQPVQIASASPNESTTASSILIVTAVEATSTFIADLKVGATGSEVVALQKYLIQKDLGPAASALASMSATGYFGALTKAALVEFQRVVGISPASGYFGSLTRAYIASH